MAYFEVIEKYKDAAVALPERKTAQSAGYDLAAAEDIIVPSYLNEMRKLSYRNLFGQNHDHIQEPYSLEAVANLTKVYKIRPTLVPTGLKCKLDPGTYLELSVRSSAPLKHWLILANGVGIIDADYYNNPDNEGHIYLQLINLSPVDIIIHKGEAVGQGIIKPYLTTENDVINGTRVGGFGSTSEQ